MNMKSDSHIRVALKLSVMRLGLIPVPCRGVYFSITCSINVKTKKVFCIFQSQAISRTLLWINCCTIHLLAKLKLVTFVGNKLLTINFASN